MIITEQERALIDNWRGAVKRWNEQLGPQPGLSTEIATRQDVEIFLRALATAEADATRIREVLMEVRGRLFNLIAPMATSNVKAALHLIIKNLTDGATPDWITNALKTEWSEEFVERMRNRMLVSFAKYGPIKQAFPAKIDALASLQDRLNKYRETSNTEWLVDAANFALIEYLCPSHPQAHFRATDSDESPGRISLHTQRPTFQVNGDGVVERLRRRQEREGD